MVFVSFDLVRRTHKRRDSTAFQAMLFRSFFVGEGVLMPGASFARVKCSEASRPVQ
jgi:hypothetical protein